jgi:hypothetical protein
MAHHAARLHGLATSHCSTQIYALNAAGEEPAPERNVGFPAPAWLREEANAMHEIIYLIGLVVVVMFILGALGIR